VEVNQNEKDFWCKKMDVVSCISRNGMLVNLGKWELGKLVMLHPDALFKMDKRISCHPMMSSLLLDLIRIQKYFCNLIYLPIYLPNIFSS